MATADFLGKPQSELNIITCHLGNGCSMAAIRDGKVVDTTMGLTPLEGLMMGTRCGDIDAAAVIRLAEMGNSPKEIDTILNKKSGLFGVGDIQSGDMRDMLAAEEKGSERAALALKMFVRRVAKYIGSYYVLTNGPEALVFTGGIGEYSVEIRRRIMNELACLGLYPDTAKNEACFGKKDVISTADSRWKAIVMPTDEELMIARNTLALVKLHCRGCTAHRDSQEGNGCPGRYPGQYLRFGRLLQRAGLLCPAGTGRCSHRAGQHCRCCRQLEVPAGKGVASQCLRSVS